jgi:hypothetical protein
LNPPQGCSRTLNTSTPTMGGGHRETAAPAPDRTLRRQGTTEGNLRRPRGPPLRERPRVRTPRSPSRTHRLTLIHRVSITPLLSLTTSSPTPPLTTLTGRTTTSHTTASESGKPRGEAPSDSSLTPPAF